jgi:hypothetical protein
MSAVAAPQAEQGRLPQPLRASVAFSFGSHDEWNISHVLNERAAYFG